MSIKILVALNEAFQVLQAHLVGMPSSVRSERLRALASIGLQIQTGKLQAAICAPDPFVDGGAIKTPFLQFPVVLNEAYPDLFHVLRDTPARLRAERLRSLALLGLHAVTLSPGNPPVQPVRPAKPLLELPEAKPTTRAVPENASPTAAKVQLVKTEKTLQPENAEAPALIEHPDDTEDAPRKMNSRLARLARTPGT